MPDLDLSSSNRVSVLVNDAAGDRTEGRESQDEPREVLGGSESQEGSFTVGLPGAVLGEEQIAARFRSKRVLARYDAGEAEAAGCIRSGCGRTGLASILAVQGEDGFADWRAGEGIQDLSLNRGRCLGEDRCGKQEKEKGRADHDSRISRVIDKGAVAPPGRVPQSPQPSGRLMVECEA